jgi:hypothetical protein
MQAEGLVDDSVEEWELHELIPGRVRERISLTELLPESFL